MLDQRGAARREGRRANLQPVGRPLHGGDGQGPFGQCMADPRCAGGAVQSSVQTQQGGDLARADAGLQIAVLVEQGLLGVIPFTDHRPIDLSRQQRLWVKVGSGLLSRPFQLTDGHAVLVEDAKFQFVDDRPFRPVRGMDGEAQITAGGDAPVEIVIVAIAGLDATDFPVVSAVIREVDGEAGAIGRAPFHEHTQGRADIAEIHRDAVATGHGDRPVTEGGDATGFLHLGGVLGRVEIDLDDLESTVGRRVVAPQA